MCRQTGAMREREREREEQVVGEGGGIGEMG